MSSVTSEVSLPPPIDDKKNSEFFDDSMICEDDWLDYDDVDDEDKDEKSQYGTVESPPLVVTEEIPPKDDGLSSAVTLFASPKRKKTKFPNFDELLQNLNFDVLNLNFTKLLLFLENTNKEMTFLFTLEEYEEFFKIVLEDINILKSKSLDTCYRDICDKILKAAIGYMLTYVYEYNMDFQKIVMVIKKEPINMMDQSDEDTSPVSLSKECVESSRVANPKVYISVGFKIHCLRTMLAFIKNDETKTKVFPGLSSDQAVYMEMILESNETCNDFESDFEVKHLYRALWEAMKIYSLKYEFKIECVDTCCRKKNLTFEKIPRQKSESDGDSNQTVNLNSNTENLENPESDDTEPRFAKPEISKLPIQHTPARLTKKLLQKQIKSENEVLLIKRLPAQFVTETLNSVLEFLLDDEKDKLVFMPKNQVELSFHRKVIDWCHTQYSVSKFGEEFEKLHYEISSLLPHFEIQLTKRRANKINEITGVREVVYIKNWYRSNPDSLDTVRSATKKKKVNLQNALELAGTGQIQLTSVVDLNQSLRNKKKNKKQKKAKSKRANALASQEASSKGSTTSKAWTDDSSSARSSRSTSRDRAKLVRNPQSVSKNAVQEKQSAWRHETMHRRYEEMNRQEQLKEALSVPVQSDKAVRMMRGMGWSGGALGARGIGITEPLMPKLDIPRGAGLGHIRGSQPETTARKPNETKATTSWVSENQTVIENTENDIIVKKTKELLRENATFDSITKTVEIPKQWESNATQANVELTKRIDLEVTKPNVELSKTNVELTKSNVELTKRNVEVTKLSVELSNVELTKSSVELTQPVIFLQDFARHEFLNRILELAYSHATHKTFRYRNKMSNKGLKFVKNFVSIVNRRKVNYSIFAPEEFNVYTQIQLKFNKNSLTFLEAKFSYDFKRIDIIKIVPAEQTPTQQMLSEINVQSELKKPAELLENPTRPDPPLLSPDAKSVVITEEYVKSFIISTNSRCTNPKTNAILKFKVLFLFNILNFVKSQNEESEVRFNKVLTLKEKSYIQNIVDEVNMRIRFGSTPAETKLCDDIKEHIANAFLGAMFNHQYTVVTLNKYFRFNRLNRPDNEIKLKCQTNMNLDIYKSETIIQANVDTSHELTDKENDNKIGVNNNDGENEIKGFESCNNVSENFSKVVEDCSKFAENNSEVAENNSKVAENNSKVAENNSKVAENSTKIAENSTKVAENCSNMAENCSIITENCSKLAEDNSTVFQNCVYKDVLQVSSEDDIISYDSDESSVEEYNSKNATATVPRLPPGEEGVNLSCFLYLYEKRKTNTCDVRDLSNNIVPTTNMTENINNKNNIGNGNVVIDNYDNQIIDMKRDTNIKITDKETDAIDSEIKRSEIDTANDVRKDEVLANVKEPIDRRYSLAASWENILKNDVFVFTGNKSDEINNKEVLMKDEVIEMMEVISISDNEVTKKEEINAETKERNCNITSDGQKVKEENNKLEIKTECDIRTKGNIVLSRNDCGTQSVPVKIDTETNVLNYFNITNSEIKTVRIVHCNHPIIKLSNEKITEIQRHISNSIILTIQLPLLKCHGVQNGAIIYTCHNEKSYEWLQNTISVTSYAVLNTEVVTKMALKFCCFFDCHYLYVCKMIELYNKGVSTKQWLVEKTERDGDHIVFFVYMDKFSVKFIQESGFSLFAGVDKVHFSPIWD